MYHNVKQHIQVYILFPTRNGRDTNLIFPSQPPISPAAYSQQLALQQQDCHVSYYNNITEAPTELADSIDTTQSSCDEQKKSVRAGASNKLLLS